MFEKEKEQSFFQKTQRFLEPVLMNKYVTFLLTFYFIFEALFGVLAVIFVKKLVGALERGESGEFYTLLYLFSVLSLLSFALAFSFKNFWIASYNRYRSCVEKKYFPLFVKLDGNTLEKIGTGKSIALLSKGIKMWGTLLDQTFTRISFLTVSLSLTTYLLSSINLFLLFFFYIMLCCACYLGYFLNTKVVYERNKRIEYDNTWSRNVVKIIMAKNEILQSQKVYYEVEKLHDLHEKQILCNAKMSVYLTPFYILGILIAFLLLFTTFFFFGEQYFRGEVSLGVITALSGAILLMQKEFTNLLDFMKNFGRDFGEVQNMWNFFDSTPEITGYEEGASFRYKTGEIELKNIYYAYEGNKNIFENFDLKITGGKITAFVGPSGGGKSTLVKLIAGYLKANEGEILIDGQKLSETSLKSYYQDVGYLTQEPSVFDGTVRENLMYALQPLALEKGKDSGKGYDLEHILTLSRCEFIYDLPNGLDTEIGERGVKLSGGQKQRLAIAKIFLKNPKIIILDEPTSALDSQSEKAITQAMHELFKERTVLVIAHRLQTVKYADEIIVIDQGKIIERGNHEKLVKQKGYYAEMLELQSGF